jgi:hypothetical protein
LAKGGENKDFWHFNLQHGFDFYNQQKLGALEEILKSPNQTCMKEVVNFDKNANVSTSFDKTVALMAGSAILCVKASDKFLNAVLHSLNLMKPNFHKNASMTDCVKGTLYLSEPNSLLLDGFKMKKFSHSINKCKEFFDLTNFNINGNNIQMLTCNVFNQTFISAQLAKLHLLMESNNENAKKSEISRTVDMVKKMVPGFMNCILKDL